ncbi:hypothetical protein [Leptolyngbya sp. NIES-2104]|uniref:hypothetical protein n=1 Tax=Leptolyngbya sp. NIES-2104 TaxID=1552121 RepID=UPI0006ECC22A|nr:hypothetical protein [Leptolyngbya sp. NIES-2104]GAP99866.1 hypothetical protein NIES2104_64320 [Leptolyngbya sp. NIES-2104]
MSDRLQQSQRDAGKFSSSFVQEWSDEFLALFPHRYDFIWADHAQPKEKPSWKTESRYPLSDRVIQQSTGLYGVRFGSQTQYCLLDIDIQSFYHPAHDPFAISRIAATLEVLGLVQYLACTSSYSGGLHLYFPLSQAVSSWQLAIVISTLLENAGFKIRSGQLEVFPNPKPYSADGTLSLFNAHRLPLQVGSYLLNRDLEPIWSTQQQFAEQWKFAQQQNELDSQLFKRILKQAKHRLLHISGKADKFIADLNAEIELGWTSSGQTNRLLGRITMREYIFHHVLAGGEPLIGTALVNRIVEVARSLPGYTEFCNHQHEIEHRAEEWARCVENSHYFHYGEQNGKFRQKSELIDQAVEKAPTWNQQQSENARDRIRSAIADLLEKESLPTNATARFKVLLHYKIGGGSLYKHRDLWHPEYLSISSELTDPDSLDCENSRNISTQLEAGSAQELLVDSTSLLPGHGGNSFLHPASSDCVDVDSVSLGSNFTTEQQAEMDCVHLAAIEDLSKTFELENATDSNPPPAPHQVMKMQRFLDSGDPILQAEAYAWSHYYPGWLRFPSG